MEAECNQNNLLYKFVWVANRFVREAWIRNKDRGSRLVRPAPGGNLVLNQCRYYHTPPIVQESVGGRGCPPSPRALLVMGPGPSCGWDTSFDPEAHQPAFPLSVITGYCGSDTCVSVWISALRSHASCSILLVHARLRKICLLPFSLNERVSMPPGYGCSLPSFSFPSKAKAL